MNHDLLVALNTNPSVLVKYITKRFTYRLMNCTRLLDVIDEDFRYGIDTPKLNNNPDIICVYDWDNLDWRAFRWDSVKEWRINND